MGLSKQSIARVPRSADLVRQADAHWGHLREVGKAGRLQLTDAIKAFNDYVDNDGNGRTQPEHIAYMRETRTVYAPFGLNTKQVEARRNGHHLRDALSEVELIWLYLAEVEAAGALFEGMRDGLKRTEVRLLMKERVHSVYENASSMVERMKRVWEGL